MVRRSRSRPRRITTSGRGSWGTRTSSTASTRTRRSPSGWWSRATTERAYFNFALSLLRAPRVPSHLWRVGPGYGKKGHHYVRTVCVSGGESGDYDADLHAFPWLFSYNGKMLSLAQFVAQVNILPGMRNLVTFGGQFPTLRATGAENLEAEIREICANAKAEAGGTGAVATGAIVAGAIGSGPHEVRGAGHLAGGGEGKVPHKGALLRDGNHLQAQRMSVVHCQCAVDECRIIAGCKTCRTFSLLYHLK